MLQYIKKDFYKELHVGYPLVTCGKAARIDAELIQSEDCEDAMKTWAWAHGLQLREPNAFTYTEFGNIRLVRKTLKTLRTLKTLKNIKMLRT